MVSEQESNGIRFRKTRRQSVPTGDLGFTGDLLVALSFENGQTLAIGHFNPHIFTPLWLTQNGICAVENLRVRFVPLRDGIGFESKDVRWQIDFESFLLESATKNCGDLVAKVIEILPHTPVRAVGHNFQYSGTKVEWKDSPFPVLDGRGWADFKDLGEVEQVRWSGVFFKDALRIEVTLAESETGIAVLFNFHRDTKGNTQATIAAAKEFHNDKAISREYLERLFKQGVKQ